MKTRILKSRLAFFSLATLLFSLASGAQTSESGPPSTPATDVAAVTAPVANVTMSSVIGKWKTIDDETGKPKSVVDIFADGKTVKGKIVELIDPPEAHPTCKECSGDKKDKPVQGLEIIWDMKETKIGEEWTGGQILDPKNGKTYKCRLRLKDGGKKLEVRGFVGFSLLGRSQTWLREN